MRWKKCIVFLQHDGPSRRNISIVLIKKLCDGLDLTLNQFFDGPEFDGLEQEIR